MSLPHRWLTKDQARFAAAHAARSLAWSMTDLFLAWHLHSVVGFSGMTVSVLLAVFLLTGAAANLAVGQWLTAMRARGPDYVRLQLKGTIATAALLTAQFLVRDPVAVVVAGIAFRLAYAVQDIPQNALGSLLPVGDAEMMRYARLRVTLSGAARIVAIAVHLLLLRFDPAGSHLAAFAIIGALMVASAWHLRSLRFAARATAPVGAPSPILPRPDGLLRILIGFAVAGALLPTLHRLMIFTPGGTGARLGEWLLAAFCAGSIAGPIAHRRLIARLGDREALRAALLVTIASALFVVFGQAAPIRILAAGLHGMALGVIGVDLWAGAATVAIRDAARGVRRDGQIVSAVIIATQISIAAGSLLLGPLIDRYEAGVPDATIIALVLVGGGALAIGRLNLTRRTPPVAA